LIPRLVSVLIVLSVFSKVEAQTFPVSSLQGVVTDPSGAPLKGAVLELRGTTLIGGPQLTETGPTGDYRFTLVPTGVYDVTARYPGLTEISRRGIVVPLSMTLRVDLSLPLAPVRENVEITGRSPMIDIGSASIPTHIDSVLLSDLPTTRSLGEILDLAPGVVRNSPRGGSAFGGTISSNAVSIDGVDVTEPRRQAIWLPVNYNWIEEAKIVALGAEAEYGNFTGAAASLALRSGTNRVAGLGEYWTTRQSWVDDNTGNGTPRRIFSLWELSGQIGGPVVRDRLWYFGGLQYYRLADSATGYTGADQTSTRIPRGLLKATAAPRSALRLDGFWERSRLSKTGDGLSTFVPLEATSITTVGDDAWTLRGTWVAPSTLVEIRTGGFGGDQRKDPTPPAGLSGPPAQVERSTNTASMNALDYSRTAPSRWNAGLSLTTFTRTGRHQTHELKLGLEHEWTHSVEERGIPGNLRLSTVGGVPASATGWDGEITEASGRQTTFYAQDRWNLTDRITLSPGVRAEINRGSIPDSGTLLATNPVAPRIGAAWDVASSHRTVVKAHYGRYYDELLTNRVGFMDIARQHQMIFYSAVNSGQLVEVGRSAPLTRRSIDTNIKQSFVDQYVAGVEQQVSMHLLVQAQYIHREFGHFMGMTDTGSLWTPTEIHDPGPDDQFGTADDGGLIAAFRLVNPGQDYLFYTNPSGAFRRYDAVQLVGKRRYADHFEVQASYTWARNRGTVGNQDFVNAAQNDLGETPSPTGIGVFMNPNALINADGRAPYDLNEFKLLGTYRAPVWGGVIVGAVFRHETGFRWGRILNVFDVLAANQFVSLRPEQRGAREADPVNNLDLRIQETFPIAAGARLAVVGEVFNVTNQGTPLFIFGANGPAFGRVLARSDPRMLRLAFRVEF
jgi:Carboxypeptidase regulatory-like domain